MTIVQQLCLVSGIESASCNMTDISAFADCICLNVGLQSDFNQELAEGGHVRKHLNGRFYAYALFCLIFIFSTFATIADRFSHVLDHLHIGLLTSKAHGHRLRRRH